jgi:LmbE family N-acetylglucosaminyl deacetylase
MATRDWRNALSPAGRAAPGAPVIALIAAHPDDEVIGAGSLIPSMKRDWLVHVTDGAPRDLVDAYTNGSITREQYAAARHRESRAALALAGFPEDRLIPMDLVDQETLLDLAGLARALCVVMTRLTPEAVLTHPYEGGHPDHDATAFAVHAGRALLSRSKQHPGPPVPEVLEMACYHAGPDGEMIQGRFLSGDGPPIEHEPTKEELDLKRRMVACFSSQRSTLSAFDLRVERYRLAPSYDFTKPPHMGRLFYERLPWGVDGAHFARLAREALTSLGLEGPL